MDEIPEKFIGDVSVGEADVRRASSPPADWMFLQPHLLDLMHDAVITTDMDGIITGCNRAMRDIYGFTAEEAIGKSVTVLYPEEERVFLAKTLIPAVMTTGVFRGELCNVTQSGVYIYVHLTVALLRDADGMPCGMVGFSVDVTSQKLGDLAVRRNQQFERELKEQQFVAKALQMSDQAFASGTPDGRLLYFNRAFAKLTGYTAKELCSTTWDVDLTPAEWRDHERQVLDELHRTGSAQVYEKEYIRKDGIRIPLEIRVHLSENGDGSCYYYSFLTDISERKRSEKALRANEAEARAYAAELQTVLEVSPAITFLSRDPKCEHVTSSRHAYDFLRIPYGTNSSKTAPEAERPMNFRVMKNGQEIQGDELPLQQAAALGHAIEDAELTLVFDNGLTRVILGNAAPLFDEAGNVRGSVATFIDITERKRAEEALRKNEKLAAAGRLASSMAHEINNPLSAVTNLLYLLKSAPPEQVPEYASTALDELGRVSAIVTEALRFNRQSTFPTQFKIGETLEAVLALYQGRLRSAHIELTRHFDGTAMVFGYQSELKHMFAHVLANAVEACRLGGRIIIRERPSKQWNTSTPGVRVTVADSGCGMDRQTLSHLFEPFFSTKGETNMGLGLWIAQEIVHKHHGAIKVRSRKGSRPGTVVSIVLPLKSESERTAVASVAGGRSGN